MKITSVVFLLFAINLLSAQRKITSSETLKIEGKVKAGTTFTIADLEMYPKVPINDQQLYNQAGQVKGTATNMKGVSLKTVLEGIAFEYDKPKELNEFYFVLVATDGYKVVFSWNEIYNSEAGNNFFIVTEMDGKPIREMDERILFIATADLKAGRRYIKALEKIQVKRAE